MKFYRAEEKARVLEQRAKYIREKAFEERPLPDFWRVGQLVRMLKDQEWCWNRGNILVVSQVRFPKALAADADFFYVSPRGKNPMNMYFYCTPSDVELYRDWPLPKKDADDEKI